MNCRRVRKRMALHAGGDLIPATAHRVEAHLQACESCRTEHAAYVESLRLTRRWIAQAAPAWSEETWRQAVGRAVEAGSRSSRPQITLLRRPAWAYAGMALMAAVLSFLVVRPMPEQEAIRGPVSDISPASSPQDVVSMTLVSKETGLKVQWFLNRNFKLEEESE